MYLPTILARGVAPYLLAASSVMSTVAAAPSDNVLAFPTQEGSSTIHINLDHVVYQLTIKSLKQ